MTLQYMLTPINYYCFASPSNGHKLCMTYLAIQNTVHKYYYARGAILLECAENMAQGTSMGCCDSPFLLLLPPWCLTDDA